MRSVGAILSPYHHPPEAMHAAVVDAEQAGVEELWIWEDCFRQSAYAVAGAALAWSESVRVGIGISPMPLRNAAVSAMEIATLSRMFPGRLLPGVGHGVQSWMQQVGARPASPLSLLREYVPALRALLAGERVSVEGRYVTLRDVGLDWPPPVPPSVYAAAEGPKTLALAGEVADGVVLDSGHTVAELSLAVERVREGRAAAGRTGAPRVVAYVVTAFGDDAAARAVAALGERSSSDDAVERVLAGTVADVAEQAEAFFAAGVDDLVLLPTSESPLDAFFRDAGALTRSVRESARR
jgi:alkanesulfonate monooxygenase SsuD/methylene tetrahydromethanopterin reductase-like flavin-dependent oxidoreductase (luciferase family)